MVEEDWTSECWETRAVKTEHWVTLIPRVLFREGCRQISKGVAASFLYRFWRHHCLTEDTTNVGVIWAGDGDNDVGMVGLWAGIVPPVHDPSLAKAIAGTESTLRTHFPLDSVKKASALSVLDGLRVWTGKQEDLFNFTEHCGEGMLSEAVQQWWDEKEKKEPAEESMAQEFVASLGPDASMPGLSH
jgi:hypothetical protein